MAASPVAVRVTRWRGAALGVCLALANLPLGAQTRITLSQLGFRKGPDYSATYAGQRVIVRGVVSAPAFHFAEYSTLAIQDGNNGGVLKVALPDSSLDRYHPGDELEAEGTVVMQNGMTMVGPEKVTVLGRRAAPQPLDLSTRELQSTLHLGELVRTQGTVQEKAGYNGGGAVILLPGQEEIYRLFIPRAPGAGKANLEKIRKGDTVRVTGIALQYCPALPYNASYELLVADANDVVPIERPPAVPQPVIASGIVVVLLVSFFLWSRERRLRAQRKRLRQTFKLGEEILGASSAAAILKRISEALPGIVGVTRVQLYVYNRTAKTLDAIEQEGVRAEAISLSSPPGGDRKCTTLCRSRWRASSGSRACSFTCTTARRRRSTLLSRTECGRSRSRSRPLRAAPRRGR